jgi:hypothetical protein
MFIAFIERNSSQVRSNQIMIQKYANSFQIFSLYFYQNVIT